MPKQEILSLWLLIQKTTKWRFNNNFFWTTKWSFNNQQFSKYWRGLFYTYKTIKRTVSIFSDLSTAGIIPKNPHSIIEKSHASTIGVAFFFYLPSVCGANDCLNELSHFRLIELSHFLSQACKSKIDFWICRDNFWKNYEIMLIFKFSPQYFYPKLPFRQFQIGYGLLGSARITRS